jgi:hypothetical protein
MKFDVQPFGYSHHPDLPDVEMGKERIRLVVTGSVCSEDRLDLEFHASAMCLDDVATRYHSLGEALVLVVNDVDPQDGSGSAPTTPSSGSSTAAPSTSSLRQRCRCLREWRRHPPLFTAPVYSCTSSWRTTCPTWWAWAWWTAVPSRSDSIFAIV